jgi:hypothetical protein
VPPHVCKTLQQCGASPDDLKPLLRLVRAIVISNAIHRAEMKRATWAAGTARDPHYKLTPEEPGALHPLLEIVERVLSDLEQLIHWEFTPPIELRELNAKRKPTQRTVRLSWRDAALRVSLEQTQQELLRLRANLRTDTQRARGRKATLVHPYSRQPARRRDLVRMVRAELLALHPNRGTPPRAARATANRLADDIIGSVLPPQ